MPLYVYRCECGEQVEIAKPLAELDREETCPSCAETMERKICAPRIVMDYAGYSCPITGNWIEGKRAHEENLARHGCRVLETGEHQENTRRREAEEARLDAGLDDTVEAFIHDLPTRKREQLMSEIAQGADTAVTRTSPEA